MHARENPASASLSFAIIAFPPVLQEPAIQSRVLFDDPQRIDKYFNLFVFLQQKMP
jgi:hypothetical protein